MQVNEVMTPAVETIAPDVPVREAARRMRDRDVGCLPVLRDGALAGMVTDRDITTRVVALGHSLDTPVEAVMSTGLVWCFADDDIDIAAETMEREQIRRLPVLDRDRRLAGIVSLGDLSTRTGDRLLAGEVTCEVSQPGHIRH